MGWFDDNKRWALPVGVIGVALVAFLAFGVFGIHTAFIDDTVDEAVPVFESGAAPSGIPGDDTDEAMADAMNDAMAADGTPEKAEVEDDMPMTTGVSTSHQGAFGPRSHPGEGTVLVLTDGSQRFLRFEEFRTDNGPDLNVYLSTAAPDAPAGEFDDDFVDLGDLKGNIGSQNYEIPADVDLSVHRTVVVWCVRFGVAFASAPLAPA